MSSLTHVQKLSRIIEQNPHASRDEITRKTGITKNAVTMMLRQLDYEQYPPHSGYYRKNGR